MCFLLFHFRFIKPNEHQTWTLYIQRHPMDRIYSARALSIVDCCSDATVGRVCASAIHTIKCMARNFDSMWLCCRQYACVEEPNGTHTKHHYFIRTIAFFLYFIFSLLCIYKIKQNEWKKAETRMYKYEPGSLFGGLCRCVTCARWIVFFFSPFRFDPIVIIHGHCTWPYI